MTMIPPDKIDATMAGYGIGAATKPDPRPSTDAEIKTLRHIIRNLERERKNYVDGMLRLDAEANDRAAKLESEVASWRFATYALGALWLMTIGGLVMGMAG